jgi:hypothetical protein
MKTEKEILPHGDFRQLDENLWVLDGTLPHHMPLPRSMTVFRMRDGGLWIHSAIALDEPTQRKMESFGKPKYLVVPNTMHRMDAPVYKATYPSITVVCPEGAIKKVSEKVPVDASCENAFQGSEVIVHTVPGAKPIELAYELPLASGGSALIFNDLLVNVTETPGVLGKFLKLIGRVGSFRSPPSNKMLLLNDRKAFQGWLKSQSLRPEIKIITVAHGEPVTQRAPQRLGEAALQV